MQKHHTTSRFKIPALSAPPRDDARLVASALHRHSASPALESPFCIVCSGLLDHDIIITDLFRLPGAYCEGEQL
jgi:hypothetical protein